MQAKLVLLLKVDGDLSLLQSYKPVSLLSTDYKLLVTILTARVNGFIAQYVHLDQVGFIQKRQLRDSIRNVCSIIQFVRDRKLLTVLCFIDAEKAFDRVDWEVLQEVLRRMGFGQSFMSWITLIYSAQEAEFFSGRL